MNIFEKKIYIILEPNPDFCFSITSLELNKNKSKKTFYVEVNNLLDKKKFVDSLSALVKEANL